MNGPLPLIVIGGATAAGKSKLALSLCETLNAEIISADSMQIYKYMDIGTAKPSKAELARVKHYMIDELAPDAACSVALYADMAAGYIKQVLSRGKLPILAGGTGFYINAVLYAANFTDCTPDYEYRRYLYNKANLHDMLKTIDPEAAQAIHPNNIKRIARALEFYKQTGVRISDHNEEQKAKKSPYDYLFFVTDMPREQLYERINNRVDEMIERGLVNEVKALCDMGYHKGLVSQQGLGYREIYEYLDGAVTLDCAITNIKQNTRRFAKRQITWFSNKTNAVKIDMQSVTPDDVLIMIHNRFKGTFHQSPVL